MEFCSVAGIKLPRRRCWPSLRCVPESPLPIDAPDDHRTFREIVYAEEEGVGYLFVRFLQRRDEHGSAFDCATHFCTLARARPSHRAFSGPTSGPMAFISTRSRRRRSGRGVLAQHQRDDDLILEMLNTMSHSSSRIARNAELAADAGSRGRLRIWDVRRRPQPALPEHGRALWMEYWTYTLRVAWAGVGDGTDQACSRLALERPRDRILDDAFGEDANSFEANCGRERRASRKILNFARCCERNTSASR